MIAISAFSSVVRLSGFMSSLLACAFSCGDPDGGRRRRGNAGTENGVGGEAECVFAQAYWLCRVFRGEYVGGCAPPNLRQRAIGSLDSLHLIRSKVPLIKHCNNRYPELPHPRPPHPGTRKDPPESNLCSGRSGCTAIISIRSNDQTRAARRQRRGVGLHARSGLEAALRPGYVREAVWPDALRPKNS